MNLISHSWEDLGEGTKLVQIGVMISQQDKNPGLVVVVVFNQFICFKKNDRDNT